MSQTKEIKSIVLRGEERGDTARRAKLAGIVRGCGSLSLTSRGVSLTVSTENEQLLQKAVRLIKHLYRTDAAVTEQSSNLHCLVYEASVFPPRAHEVLRDLGVLGGEDNLISDFTLAESFKDSSYVANFAAGIFLACGSVYLPDEKTDGYHLEFVFSSEESAENFGHILAELNFMPKKVARKSSFVVYLKESEAISDFFATIGASGVVLKLQDIKAKREVNNLVNRQSNCITANIDKAVEASCAQRQAIEQIDLAIGIDNLPETLAEAAKLRMKYPDDTLAELSARCETLSKSALNHRFRKIIGIANELGGK